MPRQQETDFSRTIEELEEHDYGEVDDEATYMVKRIHALVKKPIGRLTPDEIGLAVTQRVGFPFVLDLAFIRLRTDPLFDGGYYPGDVLSSLIRADETIWSDRAELKRELADLYEAAMQRPLDEADTFRETLELPLDFKPPN